MFLLTERLVVSDLVFYEYFAIVIFKFVDSV